MRYKAAAKKLKQVAELADPTPADVVLPSAAAAQEGSAKRDYGADETLKESGDGGSFSGNGHEKMAVPELAVVRARAIWMEVVDGIGPSAAALMARLDALTDPERVEEANMLAAWGEKYANEITERTKMRWWRRMLKMGREKAEGARPGVRKMRGRAA